MIAAAALLLAQAGARPDLSAEISREVARQECGRAAGSDDILVCGRRRQQRRYQLTDPDAPFDPAGTVDSVAGERLRWIEDGDTGAGSCGAVGPGGWTGCFQKQWRRDRAQIEGWYS